MTEKMHPISCPPEHDHVLRRLGAAVGVAWNSLSTDLQSRLLKEATLILNRDFAHTSLEHQIKAFIREHKSSER
jgi:hypothetical protein